MVLGILGYLVFKDWGVQADMPSGGHPRMVLGIPGY